jgi:uncharacterized membrane protein YhaH (DUF805 family)
MEQFLAIYLNVIKQNYVNFEGRARRQEFWTFVLINILITIVLSVVAAVIGTGILSMLFSLATLLPTIAVGVRRLHDRDMSGWFMLLGLVPIANIVLLVIMCLEGTKGDNRFGPDPKAGTQNSA